MCSALPVYRGEIQCRMLGLAVESFSEAGTLNAPDVPGALVCLAAFPCMPAGFWPLPGFGTEDEVAAARAKYHQAYFAEIDGVWYHGDYITITHSRSGNGGGLIMLGRSDGVLYEVVFHSCRDLLTSGQEPGCVLFIWTSCRQSYPRLLTSG
jgi:acetoacetyl-CoA synthetase